MIKHIKEEEFESVISSDRVLVDFYATWCGPCKMLGLVLEKFDKRNIIPIIKVDVDQARNVANEYKILSVPTLIIFENKKEIKRTSGFMSEDELVRWVSE